MRHGRIDWAAAQSSSVDTPSRLLMRSFCFLVWIGVQMLLLLETFVDGNRRALTLLPTPPLSPQV